MMKKLLIFMLVLGMACVANALSVGIESGGSSTADVLADQVVTVDVTPDFAVEDFLISLGQTTTSAAGEAIGALGTVSTSVFDLSTVDGYLVNGAPVGPYVIMSHVSGIIQEGSDLSPAGTSVYSFTITIPSAASIGDTFTIDDVGGYINPGYPPTGTNFNTMDVTAASALVLTVIPEPMTVLLLGLGGLLLMRRRR
jgi:hypothetical protein